MDALISVADELRARLKLDRKYFKRSEYESMEHALESLRSMDLAAAKCALNEVREKLDARKRKLTGNVVVLSHDIELERDVAKREVKLVGAIMVDEKLRKELGL